MATRKVTKKRKGATLRNLVDQLGTEDFSRVLERAESGSPGDARDSLRVLADLLSTKGNRHPLTGDLLPVPEYVRDYLARALYRMSAGEDSNRALHLKRAGRNKWTHHEKLIAVSIVAQLIAQGFSVDSACAKAEEEIREHASRPPNDAAAETWRKFKNGPKAEQLKNWYYEIRSRIRPGSRE